jgi:hypothetical protein
MGMGTSGTFNILTGNTSGTDSPAANNEIKMRLDIAGARAIDGLLVASCATGDAAAWKVTALVSANKTAASVAIVGTPSWTLIGESSGASSGRWTPAFAVDNTRGGIYPTVSGTCKGGKAIHVTFSDNGVEVASHK